jgi:hypothetical protein
VGDKEDNRAEGRNLKQLKATLPLPGVLSAISKDLEQKL